MQKKEFDVLVSVIADASRQAFTKLFASKEHFYYCTMLTTGEGFPPIISAWSLEALKRESALHTNPKRVVLFGKEECFDEFILFSYADSPYYAFGYEEYFKEAIALYTKRGLSVFDLGETKWEEEFDLRLKAMGSAMKQLDLEGLFSQCQSRDDVCLEVGTMPPDDISLAITQGLNNPNCAIMKQYMKSLIE